MDRMKKDTKLICAVLLLVGAALNMSLTVLAAQMDKLLDKGYTNVPLFDNLWEYISYPMVAVSGVLLVSGVMMLCCALKTKTDERN